MEFLKLMRRMDVSGHCQIITATHSPMLMAYHYKVMREFCADPAGFVEAVIDEWKPHRRDDDRF